MTEMGSKSVVRDSKFFVDPQGVQMPTRNLVKQVPGRSVSQLMTNSDPILDRARPLSMGSSPFKPANNNTITDRKRPLLMVSSSPKPAKTVCIVPRSCNSQAAISQIARVLSSHRVGRDLWQQKGSEVSASSSTCTVVIQSSCDPLPTSRDMLVQEVLEAKRNVQLWTNKEAEAKEVLRQFDHQREAKLEQLEMELKEEKAQEALMRSNWINEQQRIMELEKQLKQEREARKDIDQ